MTIPIANTPLSWGIHSVEHAKLSFADLLEQIHATGYAGTELGPWGYFPTAPDILREHLQACDLALASATIHVRLTDPEAHEPGAAHALEVAQLLAALGAQYLVLADEIDPDSEAAHEAGRVRGPRLSDDEWDTLTAGVLQIARVINDQLGVRLAFHHHAGTYIETAEEVRMLMDRLPDTLVGLCLDTGHWRYAGGAAADAIDEFGARIWHVHLADIHPDVLQFAIDEQLTFDEAMQAGVFCSLGEGMVPFPTIIGRLRRINYPGWIVVEQDVLLEEPDADRTNAHSNREYLRKLGL